MVEKENIKPFTQSAISLLREVPIIQFNYNGTSDLKVGYITNEVEPPFTDRTKSKFEQGNCIALLIKAVQELNLKVSALEAQNMRLRMTKGAVL